MVESQPSKLLVAGSIPVSRSIRRRAWNRRALARWHATEVGHVDPVEELSESGLPDEARGWPASEVGPM